MSKLTIGLILGSTREGRLGERVAKFVQRAVEKEHKAVLFDPKDIKFSETQQSMNWLFKPEAVPDNIKQLNDKVAACDALVAITAEYNFSIPPALANIVDNLPSYTFVWKPCAIVSYSISPLGGWRGALQVRQMLGAVGCTLTQKQMAIGVAQEALDDKGVPVAKDGKLDQELNTTLAQLYWLTGAINNHKKLAPDAVPPFKL